MDKTAVKSMLTLALALVAMIVVWSVIGHIAFPHEESEDKLLSYVTKNEPLLTQMAEAAMDEERWPGLMDTPEVQALIKEGGIEQIEGTEDRAIFRLAGEIAQEERALLYFPQGSYDLARVGRTDEGWQTAGSAEGLLKWTAPGGASLSARRLTEEFWLEDAYVPA